jgi:hypothetical protein
MGNGFTFELETLIFIGIISGVTGLRPGLDFLVYGDDIIVPKDAARNVLSALRLFGFTPNERKTFVDGPFRESCGGDYFAGVPVRALFVKKTPSTPTEWISLHNALKARLPRNNVAVALLKGIREQVPLRWRLTGPSRVGDLAFHHASHWKTLSQDGILWLKGVACKTDLLTLDRWGHEFLLTLALLGVQRDGIAPRGAVTYPKTVLTSIS